MGTSCPFMSVWPELDMKDYLWRPEENMLIVPSPPCLTPALTGHSLSGRWGLSQLLLGVWMWPVEYRSHANRRLSWQLCEAELQDQPFLLTSGGRCLGWGRGALGFSFCFFSTNFTLGGVMVNDNCSITSCPRNRTKMTFTFEEDFNLWFFF